MPPPSPHRARKASSPTSARSVGVSGTGLVSMSLACPVVPAFRGKPSGRGALRVPEEDEDRPCRGAEGRKEIHREHDARNDQVVHAGVSAESTLATGGPPSSVITIHTDVNPVALVIVGAAAAVTGRFLLAVASRKFGQRLNPDRRARLAEAREALTRHRAGSIVGLALFAVSPLPSGQLFVAAGLLDVPLVPVTAAFFAGRIVSYSFYVALATVAQKQLGPLLGQVLGSPLSVALQVVLLAIVAALPFVHWRRLLARLTHRRAS
jgi:uncharacterized membrane protein YdjX (TVP38/TMEM64 family)